MEFLINELSHATFWVAVAFFLFMGGVAYLGAFKMVGKILDDRADGIRKELDDARTLREDAQALLASYERKQKEAEKEAEEIITQAKHEADRLQVEAEAALAEQMERRSKAAEDKIASAEAQAIKEVQAVAVDIAIAAATAVIKDKVDAPRADKLIAESIEGLKDRLH